MNQTFLKVIFSFSLFTCFSANVYAAKRHYKMEVSPGGYKFYSSYKLKIPASHDHPEKKLKIHAVIGPETGIEKFPAGKVFPSMFLATLNFKHNGEPACVEAYYDWNRKKRVAKENFSFSSEWYKGMKGIFHKVAEKQFDTLIPWLLKERANWRHVMKTLKPKEVLSKSDAILLKALPGARLEATYSIRARPFLPIGSKIPPRIIVKIIAKKEHLASFKNKRMLTVTATFHAQRGAKIKDPESTVKFVKTKKGFKEIGRMDLPEAASIWYPWVKQVVKRGAVQYAKLKEIHEHATSK